MPNDTQPKELSSLLPAFTESLKKKGRATATILAYQSDIKQLIKFLIPRGKKYINDIATEDVEAFKGHLLEKKYSRTSVSRKINSIKTFFRFLKKETLVEKNVTQDISQPKYKLKAPRILSKMEYRALRDVCRDDTRMYTIVELLLQTGIRISELANLSTDHVSNSKILIKASESRTSREIPLNKAANQALKTWLEERPKSRSKALFLTKTGKPFQVRNIRACLNRYFKLADLKDVCVNDLRHTFVAHQLKAGAPVVLVQKLAGHKHLTTTERYLQFIKEKEASTDSMKLEEL